MTERPIRPTPVIHGYQQESKTNQVRKYVTEHTEFEMTFTQLQRQFDISKASSHDIVRTLKEEGLIESVHVVRAKGRAE